MSQTDGVDRYRLADRARRVKLRPRYEQLADIAVDLHLLANQRSGVRYRDDSDERDRARRGYRAELATAQHYGLRPEVDYRPDGVGDLGRDLWARHDDQPVAIDVKATTSDPPRLYLTQKRAWSDRYNLPDCYLLASCELTADDSIHLLGWCSCDQARQGRETEVYDNPVWVTPLEDLDHPPARDELEDIDQGRQLKLDAARTQQETVVTDGGDADA